MGKQTNAVKTLRRIMTDDAFITMPCCFDGLSAKLIQEAGFNLTFMSGFSVSAARLGLPDTGLISYAEMADQLRNITDAVDIPVIGDGDTGYGNPVNVKRTVTGYARAGAAGIMIEDQVSPKRCGHTKGKDVVDRAEALRRMRAAVEAREDIRAYGDDIVIVARTDARGPLGLKEAMTRAACFADMGADILFVEAPQTEAEMREICREVGGFQMANMVEHGVTPVLPPDVLKDIGYRLAAYPLTLLSTAVHAMRSALDALRKGNPPANLLEFTDLQAIVGFPSYDETLQRLSADESV